jgi:alcohol dehydrogenase class IV
MMTQTYQFHSPSVIVSGPGASKEVGFFGKEMGKKALIVTDNVLEEKGVLNEIKNSMELAGVAYSVYNKVVNEPTLGYTEEGLSTYKEAGADFLIAVGGGSPIDAAKAIAALVTNPGRKITEFLGANKIPNPGSPLIAIPTTAGTGSEVTQFTIIIDTERDMKMVIGSPMIMPKVALVDPLLTLSMPQSITMATGLDALTHAIEAYVSVKAHPLTDTLALQAIRIIGGNLRQAWSNGDNLEARTNMIIGSLHAGLACSNASVGLVHGMARPIGAYFHVPHGVSNAVLLPIVVDFSIPGNPRRYADIAEAMGEVTEGLSLLDAAYLAGEAVERLNDDLKVPTLEGLGVEEEKFNKIIEKMADDGIASGSPGNNPRKATKQEIVELYRKAYFDSPGSYE